MIWSSSYLPDYGGGGFDLHEEILALAFALNVGTLGECDLHEEDTIGEGLVGRVSS